MVKKVQYPANLRYNEYDREVIRKLTQHLSNLKHAKIYSLSLIDMPRRVRFIIMRPQTNQICPITQDEIAASALEYPADVFNHKRTAIRLACGHDFTGLSLLFHWRHSCNIKCPLCRAGPPNDSLGVLPVCLSTHLSRRVFDMTPTWQWMKTHRLHCRLEGVDIPRRLARMELTEVGDNVVLTARGLDVKGFLRNTPIIRLTIVIESDYHDAIWPTVWFYTRNNEYHDSEYNYRIDRRKSIIFTTSSTVFRRFAFIHDEIKCDLPMSEMRHVRNNTNKLMIAYTTPPPQAL